MNLRTCHVGVRVNPMPYLGIGGGTIYAEIEPAGVRWWRSLLPHVGRWWYEVHREAADPGDCWSHAYERGGSGGSYTFRGCVRKAMRAVEEMAQPPTTPEGRQRIQLR